MALAERIDLGHDTPQRSTRRGADVVLGDDWVAPRGVVEEEVQERRARRGLFSLKRSPLTRKIITFNLIALNILVVGILYLNSTRDNLALERAASLASEAALVADVFEAQIAGGGALDPQATVDALDLRKGVDLFVFDTDRSLVAQGVGTRPPVIERQTDSPQSTVIVDGLSWLWSSATGFLAGAPETPEPLETQLVGMIDAGLDGRTQVEMAVGQDGGSVYTVNTPIVGPTGAVMGVVALASEAGELDTTVREEREAMLQMFVIATLVSIGLSLVLASTISNPLSDLATAAEVGRSRDRGKYSSGRIRIPDLTARPDEIGRLSGALRGMVSALYDRIDGNEQFAADVAHEIKNPLASLRSAVGTLRVAKRDDQREKLLDVIDHDVRRLDRLVSDISNASRLDSELVKEEQEPFNLLDMLGNLSQFLGEDAKSKGIDFITDLPAEPIVIDGLEARLAQVFVNLITNAISFCEPGDAIRIWARRKDNRVLAVVEDTGPGIPEEALTKIFKRFYSERPAGDFGNNSGLGLAISKQIVEAHGGVIWAENIRPTEADVTSEPLGARFVVGLPV
ncbi:sensor histidine kinase [Pseudaestuariivita atlantica]|uniref:histidine kinase n=1 Tax=Pseudaestuariivita atlantica TaxID=1317121 RepID=A0A0L1JP45_9RHOB|nr:sensor histidine kinase [Pseudaestuariivita atlantica]KNG93193.1 histidine kinase [Pseudaestuariivita atlantica]